MGKKHKQSEDQVSQKYLEVKKKLINEFITQMSQIVLQISELTLVRLLVIITNTYEGHNYKIKTQILINQKYLLR